MIISKITSALPEKIVANQEISATCGSDETFLTEKVGIESRHFLSPPETGTSLAIKAARELFSDVKPDEIGLCVWVGQVKDKLIPHASALLQAHLELPTGCVCFDLGLACSGYIHALAIADSLMRASAIGKALIVTCDPYSQILDMENRDTAPLFGDAATTTLLSSSGTGIEIGKSDLGTDGKGAGYLQCSPDTGNHLHMDGKGILNFAMARVPKSIKACLELNDKSMADIDYFVFHQANAFIINQLGSRMGLPKEKCPIQVRHVANTVSSSIPLVLQTLPLSAGSQVILSGFGAGLSWGTIYGKFV